MKKRSSTFRNVELINSYSSRPNEAEGRMGFLFRAHEGERNNCFSKIKLVGQKNIETKHLSLVKAIILVFKAGGFRY